MKTDSIVVSLCSSTKLDRTVGLKEVWNGKFVQEQGFSHCDEF